MSAPAWHPVALSADIPVAGTAPARLHGAEIVLWRQADGTLHAWEDRCPHRGMRLSFGFVRDDRLACLYHGWRFDGDARCRHIPAHPELKVPGTIRAAPWAAIERAGLVWLAPDGTAADTSLPDAPTRPLRSVAIARPLAEVAPALGLAGTGWTWRDAMLLAIHAPDAATTMLHAALRGDSTPPHAAARQVADWRARLEAA